MIQNEGKYLVFFAGDWKERCHTHISRERKMVRSGCKEFKERFALLNGRCIFYKHVLGKMDCYSTSRNYLKLRVISQVATAWQCPPKPRCPLICVFSGCEGHSQCLQACQMTKNPLVWEKVKIHRVELCFNGTKINFL